MGISWKEMKSSVLHRRWVQFSRSVVSCLCNPMDCRMWVERLNEKEANLSKVPLEEGGSESFQRSEDGWFSRENSKVKTLPCLAHSTQLLGLPPSGPLPAFFYYRAPSLILTVHPQSRILSWCSQSFQAYYDGWNIGDNTFPLTCVKCSWTPGTLLILFLDDFLSILINPIKECVFILPHFTKEKNGYRG